MTPKNPSFKNHSRNKKGLENISSPFFCFNNLLINSTKIVLKRVFQTFEMGCEMLKLTCC